ncbi:MAG: UDP-N-acetylmuramate--L-alanine ligase [Clostridiales bacterium]|jgi:UDP-N-acetylmuramate--alanine ligase|nr:UDP-N-acetylmuramate--L-alanine ligase [Clostridiales bacterium]
MKTPNKITYDLFAEGKAGRRAGQGERKTGRKGGRAAVGSVHMLGVNGISMSGLAEILLDLGYRVSGSDLTASNRTERLASLGAAISLGNAAEHIDPAAPPDMLVYTAAISPDNPELLRAAELGVPRMERAELLGRIMAAHERSIAVAGTHGKTTTTAMLAEIFIAEGRDPTVHIGAEYEPIGGTTRIGGRGLFLAEACEYVDSFLKFYPSIALITNVDFDHSDYFRDIAHVRASFLAFAAQAGQAVVANADDENVMRIYREREQTLETQAHLRKKACPRSQTCSRARTCPRARANLRWVFFGLNSEQAAFRARAIRFDEVYNASFELAMPDDEAVSVQLDVPGTHNVYNALAAAAAARVAGCSAVAIQKGLSAFCGAKKRFEYKGTAGGVTVVDDYAHHPSEIRPALLAAKKVARDGKVVCVFQPHTYSRTKAFLSDFAEAFRDADLVVLADIFAAREPDPGDISSAILAERINGAGGSAVHIGAGFEEIAAYVREIARPGDLVLTMGAGLAVRVADILLAGSLA